MANLVYSRRLGAITDGQFQAALDRFNLGKFVSAEPVTSGLFGQNVYLTSRRGAFILRGAPHYPWQFPTEQFITGQLAAKTNVPVAHPYLLEPSPEIFGWSFAIMPRLEGISVRDPAVRQELTPTDRLEQARALARMLVQAQALTWEYGGKFSPEKGRVEPFGMGYRHWVVENIHRKMNEALSYNDNTTPADALWAEEIIVDAWPAFDLPYHDCIVLGDYGEHNVLFQRAPGTAGGWQISAVFDLMTAHFGDGLADLSLSVAFYLKEDAALADAFTDEYLAHCPVRPGFARLQRVYMLDLLLSFWRYWQREAGRVPEDPEGRLRFRDYVEPGIRYWDRFNNEDASYE